MARPRTSHFVTVAAGWLGSLHSGHAPVAAVHLYPFVDDIADRLYVQQFFGVYRRASSLREAIGNGEVR